MQEEETTSSERKSCKLDLARLAVAGVLNSKVLISAFYIPALGSLNLHKTILTDLMSNPFKREISRTLMRFRKVNKNNSLGQSSGRLPNSKAVSLPILTPTLRNPSCSRTISTDPVRHAWLNTVPARRTLFLCNGTKFEDAEEHHVKHRLPFIWQLPVALALDLRRKISY